MALDVEPPREVYAPPPRVEHVERDFGYSRAECEALAARFASATARGVATLLPLDVRVSKDYLDETGFNAPLLVKSPAQLAMRVPAQGSVSLKELAADIGVERPVRAIDVASQRELASEWKLKQWIEYFEQPPATRERVLNLISLECSGTKLERLVQPPKVVDEIGWVEKHWPKKSARAPAPKVRLYCLMSAGGSYTEFHVDFGGSSVWYHLYAGCKKFVVIPPTDANLALFAEWENEYKHGQAPFFGDLVPPGECTIVEMRAGDTMLLPSGWIHAVYTPEDSIAFGGNFLSGYHIPTHLRCHATEQEQRIERRFFFPEFESVVWYAAAHYAFMLKTCKSMLSKWEWRGLCVLVEGLTVWYEDKKQRAAEEAAAEILGQVDAICKQACRVSPADMLERMADAIKNEKLLNPAKFDPGKDTQMRDGLTESPSIVSDTAQLEFIKKPSAIERANSLLAEQRLKVATRVAIADSSSSSSSSSEESSTESSDTSDSSDGEDTGRESDRDPSPSGNGNADTNGSSSDSSSDDDSSDTSSSDNEEDEEEAPQPPEDNKEPQEEEEPEEIDEPEESSSSDSDDDADPESAYPDLPPVPIDALIAIRKRAKLKELQISKKGKEKVVEMARQHLLEYQKSSRSKKKSGKGGSNGHGDGSFGSNWEGEERWVFKCSCGAGGQNYDDGKEMVECNKCKVWVHIGCEPIPVYDLFWCFRCRANPDEHWVFNCPCGISTGDYDDGIRMVQCEICEGWQHTSCGGIPDDMEPPERYECHLCRNLKKKTKQALAAQKRKHQKRASRKKKGSSSKLKAASFSNGTAAFAQAFPLVVSPPPPSSPQMDTSTPPPPPPPPSAPPSPSEDVEADGWNTPDEPEASPSPTQIRKRGRSVVKSTDRKSKRHDEDYVDGVNGSTSPVGVNGGSLIMRPPLPITPKSAPVPQGKRKSGSSARDRLEKKLKIRKSRG